MTKKITHYALILITLYMVTGCTSHYGAAIIQSTPPGADVIDLSNDAHIGITPVKAWWESNDDANKFVNIRLQKDGYQDKTLSFWLFFRHKSRDDALAQPQLIESTLDASKANVQN
jgi:hypothetical protein